MAKKIKAKGRGRPPTTGKGTLVGLRCHPPFLKAVDAWRGRQDDNPTRPAAIVQLAVLGLTLGPVAVGTNQKAAAKASDMAGEEIDRLANHSAPAEERDSRKRRLLKGPKEFRDMRKDHAGKPPVK